jgi:hypothetical protein
MTSDIYCFFQCQWMKKKFVNGKEENMGEDQAKDEKEVKTDGERRKTCFRSNVPVR